MSVVDLPSAPARRNVAPDPRPAQLIRAMTTDLPELPERPRSDTVSLVRWGAALAIVLFGVFGLWAVTMPLAGAVIAPGVVKVLSQRRAVQHLEGGIVKAILVHEGERAERGQLLALLDTTQIEACDACIADECTIVYVRGTLHGRWLDGSGFTGIRFVDRFEIRNGLIGRQDVWNDAGEYRERLRQASA